MAQASFRIGDRTLEVFGPRAEQIAHLLALERGKVAEQLAERIGGNVSDAEVGEKVLELDADEERELLVVLNEVIEEAGDMSPDVLELRSALRESLGV